MAIFDVEILKLAGGLLLLIAANIGLGSITAKMDGVWDEVKFRNGCIKSVVITAALVAVYAAGYLNPNLLVIEIEGQVVNLMSAVYALLMAAFVAYAVEVLQKLRDLIILPTPGSAEEVGFTIEKVGGSE